MLGAAFTVTDACVLALAEDDFGAGVRYGIVCGYGIGICSGSGNPVFW